MSRLSQPLSFEYILLGFLSEQPLHGYDLFKTLNTDPNINQIWMVKQSMLYAMLEKLEEMNLLSSEMISQGSYPTRKQYSITETGQSVFEEWRIRPVEYPREIRQEFLAKFYFAYRVGRNEARILLERQQLVCQNWLELHQQHVAETENDPFNHFIIDFKQSQMESILGWINYCLESMPK